jgi:Zn-dependent protease/CBS domain-containing protein
VTEHGVTSEPRHPAPRRGRALSLGRLAGVQVELQWSLVVVAALLTWVLATSALPALVAGEGVAVRWTVGAATAVAFLGCVLAHELSHVIVARRHGVRATGIRLWLLGGVSSLDREPPTPRADFQIAIAGPATSALLSVLLLATALLFAITGTGEILVAAFLWLAVVNAILAVFNLLPGAPLDGGRVLRAILWKVQGDRVRAAIRASQAGRVLGWSLVAAGLAELLLLDSIGGVWLMLIGWFVASAAEAEEIQTVAVYELADVRVRDVMSTSPVCAPASTTVDDLLHDYMLRYHCSSFPLLDEAGQVRSLATLSHVRRVPRSQRARARADAIACPVELVTRAAPDDPLLDVMRRSTGTAGGRVLVFDGSQLVGIVSPTDMARVMHEREAAFMRTRRAA